MVCTPVNNLDTVRIPCIFVTRAVSSFYGFKGQKDDRNSDIFVI